MHPSSLIPTTPSNRESTREHATPRSQTDFARSARSTHSTSTRTALAPSDCSRPVVRSGGAPRSCLSTSPPARVFRKLTQRYRRTRSHNPLLQQSLPLVRPAHPSARQTVPPARRQNTQRTRPWPQAQLGFCPFAQTVRGNPHQTGRSPPSIRNPHRPVSHILRGRLRRRIHRSPTSSPSKPETSPPKPRINPGACPRRVVESTDRPLCDGSTEVPVDSGRHSIRGIR